MLSNLRGRIRRHLRPGSTPSSDVIVSHMGENCPTTQETLDYLRVSFQTSEVLDRIKSLHDSPQKRETFTQGRTLLADPDVYHHIQKLTDGSSTSILDYYFPRGTTADSSVHDKTQRALELCSRSCKYEGILYPEEMELRELMQESRVSDAFKLSDPELYHQFRETFQDPNSTQPSAAGGNAGFDAHTAECTVNHEDRLLELEGLGSVARP